MKKGYEVFLMIMLAQSKGLLSTESEYDLLWETGCGMVNDFEKSEFNNVDKGLYDCIIDYLNPLMLLRNDDLTDKFNGLKEHTCLNCGNEFVKKVSVDKLGKFAECPECHATSDTN